MMKRGWRLSSVLLLLGLAACASPEPRPPELTCEDCNVLLISIDTLRADHLGCYGYSKPTSPSIDRFAGESIRFARAISHAPSTEPSHASIFTSQIPEHHAAWRSRGQPIGEGLETMAEILSAAGMRSISFNGGGQVAASYGFDRGFETYTSRSGPFSTKVGQAIRWLSENRDERFFMFLHSYEVHAPYTPRPEQLELFDQGYEGRLEDEITTTLLIDINDGVEVLDEADLQHVINCYDAEIRSVDRGFEQLVRYLNKIGVLEKTIIVFTSDHGEEFGEHGQVGQHSHALHDELLHVPLIVRLPGAVEAGRVVEKQVRSIDILPTLAQLVGLEALDQYDGVSLTELMRGATNDVRRPAISQVDFADLPPPTSIRTDEEKLILGMKRFFDDAPYRWFENRAEFSYHASQLVVPIESLDVRRGVRIWVDGELVEEGAIHPRMQPLMTAMGGAAERTVVIESVGACTPAEQASQPIDIPCASFRIFNPMEFYRLRTDPGEQENLFDSPEEAQRIELLRAELAEHLAARQAADGGTVELDEETQERLRALGYIN